MTKGVCVVGKPGPPTSPDPTTTIAAQSSANTASALQTAELNRINQVTPYGSIDYSTNGTYPDGTPKYTQTQTLAPAQQSLLNLGNQGALSLANTGVGMLNQVGSQYANPIDYSGIPAIASTVNNGQSSADAIKQAQDAAYGAQTQYLDPRFKQQQDQMNNSLINQGITQGSDAYNNAQQNFNLSKNQAYQSAQDAAISAGDTQQQALFGQGLASANLQNNASQQGLQQLYARQNQPLNEFNALMSGGQVTQPTFNSFPTSQVPTTNVAGITDSAYQNQLAQYSAQMNANPWNSILSLGGSLGAAAISDRRLKREIRRDGETGSGIPVYTFRYVDGIGKPTNTRYRGVMADEVLAKIPEAVLIGDDGFYRVDYSKVPA